MNFVLLHKEYHFLESPDLIKTRISILEDDQIDDTFILMEYSIALLVMNRNFNSRMCESLNL